MYRIGTETSHVRLLSNLSFVHLRGAHTGSRGVYVVSVILIDEPRWPAHGTTFAHLVSDTSHAELHAFVRALDGSLPRPLRFHHDHYDVPARSWPTVVEQGAQVVTTREIVRRLRAAGLRG